MQSSTAQRERLVSPLSLALMAGLFAVAFFVLKPDSVPGLDISGFSSATSTTRSRWVSGIRFQNWPRLEGWGAKPAAPCSA